MTLTPRSRSNIEKLVNASPKSFDVATSNFVAEKVTYCRGNWETFCVTLIPKVKVKNQIMYFLVNVSPPKRLDLATSNFVAG